MRMTPEQYSEREQQTEAYTQWINQTSHQAEKEDSGKFRLEQYDELGVERKTKHFMP